jgi:hypothetical protein
VPTNTTFIQIQALDADSNAKLAYFLVKDNKSLSESFKMQAYDESGNSVDLSLVEVAGILLY